jgi:signal transduction histidine kinase/CheY-like chemotaxis protein
MALRADASAVALDVSRSSEASSGRLLAVADEQRPLAPGLLGRPVQWVEVPLWALLAALLSVVATVVVGLRAGGPGLPVLGAGVAAGGSVVAAGRHRARWQPWAAMALGCGLWGVSRGARPDALLGPAGDLAHRAQPSDVVAVLAVVALAGGVLGQLDLPDRALGRLRAVLELLMIGGSVLFASWAVVLPDVFATSSGHPVLDRAALLAYPLGDVVLLSVAVFAATRMPSSGARSLPALLGGVGVVAMAGSALVHLPSRVADPAFGSGAITIQEVVDLAAVIGFLAIILAAATSTSAAGAPAGTPVQFEQARRLLLSAPGLALLIVAATSIKQATGQPVATELAWLTIGVLGLSILLHITVALENDVLGRELAVARDDALDAVRLKSYFLANMSHEVRTPMNAVIGLNGLLLDSELSPEQRELATGVATSAEGLLELIDDILDFSRLEAGKMRVEEIDLDLEDLFDDVATILGDGARRKGIELYVYCEPGLLTTRRGDPMRLRQILLNLGSNAVKFTSDGSVTIRAHGVRDDADLVVFEVTDTGIGIPVEAQERLFQPFSQLDATITRRYGGTGLGLAIVTQLVELLGARIDLESEEGVGTSVMVTVPLAQRTPRSVEQALGALSGLRALVVDGNAVNRTVLAHVLHGWGFRVDQAASADEALDHCGLGGEPYALALVDHQLEGADGLDLCAALRSQARMADAVLLLQTSIPDLDRQEAHEAGVQSVLVKPIRNAYLLRRIVDLLAVEDPRARRARPPEISGAGP